MSIAGTIDEIKQARNTIRSKMIAAGQTNCMLDVDVAWTAMTNGYYNATYNIYIYNNYTG